MRIGRFFTLALALLVGSSTSQAQDIHFSQFFSNPAYLNPAMTGVMTCDMRVSANYRNQWASVLGGDAFNTYSVSVEGRIPVSDKDYVGLGGVLWADKVGKSSFSTIQVAGSAAYLKRIGGRRSNEQYLTAGLQLGIIQRSVETTSLLFGSQFDGERGNPTLPSLEPYYNDRFAFADINAGLVWFMALDKKAKSSVYAGIAFSHLNRANVSFDELAFEGLYTKYTIHGGAEFRVKSKLSVVPNFVFYSQGPSKQAIFGSSVKFDLSKSSQSNQAFELGLYGRITDDVESNLSSDAIIAMARMRFNSSTIGLSYDINASALQPASKGNGGFELSYRYTLCGMRNRPLGCPTF